MRFDKYDRAQRAFYESILDRSLSDFLNGMQVAVGDDYSLAVELKSSMVKKLGVLQFEVDIYYGRYSKIAAETRFMICYNREKPILHLSEIEVKDQGNGLGRKIAHGFHCIMDNSMRSAVPLRAMDLHAGLSGGAYFWGRAGLMPFNRDTERLDCTHFAEMIQHRVQNVLKTSEHVTSADKDILNATAERAHDLAQSPTYEGFCSLINSDERCSFAPVMPLLLTDVKAYLRDRWLDYAQAKKLDSLSWGYSARYDIDDQAQRNNFLDYVHKTPRPGNNVLEMTRQRASNRSRLIL